jgi:tetraacyldisaccharide-1-P 4'-kinase
VEVIVAPRRAEAMEFAVQVRRVDAIVLDGVLQTSPSRAALSLLAVDAVEPWGRTGRLPPCGDLRAPPEVLREACDLVVPVGEDSQDAMTVSDGVWPPDGPDRERALLPWSGLIRMAEGTERHGYVAGTPEGTTGHPPTIARKGTTRIGLFCALARPERLLRSLRRRGLTPVRVVRTDDHGPRGGRSVAAMYQAFREAEEGSVDLWLASSKCAPHVVPPPPNLFTIDHALELSRGMVARVRALLAKADLP